jgi:hypothetical protein
MSETRVDPTVAGLFLIGFVTLVFGIMGIQMFNQGIIDPAGTIIEAAGFLIVPVAFVILIFAYMAGKVGNAFAVALFAFIAVSLFGAGSFLNKEPMLFYIVAVFYIIFAIVAFLIGAPKLLAILLILVALLFLFIGFAFAATVAGSEPDAYAIAFGLFGILSFLVATYMAVALATQKMPVF